MNVHTSIAQEIERLAQLRSQGALTEEEFARAKNRVLTVQAHGVVPLQGMRRESQTKLFGLPLWAIALGPDLERGELRGHARGIFALGDIATGWFACGGLARGLFALGGCAIGIVMAVGGAAVGAIALGGAAVGVIAFGGGACGYFAFGGGAVGIHTFSGAHQDPEAREFFLQFMPWLKNFPHR